MDKNNNPLPASFDHSGNEAKLTDDDLTLGSVFSHPVLHSSPIEMLPPTEDCLISSKDLNVSNPVLDSSRIESTPSGTNCPACQNGDFPAGAHRCMVCRKAVHIFDTCSLPIDESEEGYGEKRICTDCIEKRNGPQLIESRAYENWRNQMKKFEEKRARRPRQTERSRTARRQKQESRVERLADKKSRFENQNAFMTQGSEKATRVIKQKTDKDGAAGGDSLVNQESNSPPSEMVPFITDCPACRNGDLPGGVHRCKTCKRPVHALDSCSLPVDGVEEGYGQQRICRNCSEKQNKKKPTILRSCKVAINITKNLEGARPRGKYLQETYPLQEFLLTGELSTVPILKSGKETQLKPIRKRGRLIDLSYTYSFDSFFQLMLTTTFDSQIFFRNTIEANVAIDRFVKMIYDVHEKKVTLATYRTRSDILCEHFVKQGHPEINCLLVDCRSTVAGMCRKLLRNLPCFKETSVCKAECPPLVKHFPLLTISLRALTASTHNENIEDEIIVDRVRQCPFEDCIGELNTGLSITGASIAFEVMSTDDDKVQLKQIPQTLKLSFMAEEFHLRGIIHFDAPVILRNLRNASSTMLDDPVGHYTAFCLRNGKWVHFDRKMKPHSATCNVSPQLVMYSR